MEPPDEEDYADDEEPSEDEEEYHEPDTGDNSPAGVVERYINAVKFRRY